MRRLRMILFVGALVAGCSDPKEDEAARRESYLSLERFETTGEPSLTDLPPIRPASEIPRTDVLPHMGGEITRGRNYVFCATAKLAWDAFGVQKGQAPTDLAQAMSRLEFSGDDLNPSCYLTMKGSRAQVAARMNEKFPGVEIELAADDPSAMISYAYLQKQLPFREKFDRLESPLEFHGDEGATPVAAFGVEKFHEEGVRETLHRWQITVLDYKNKDDFVVELNTLSKQDRMILAKVPPESTLEMTAVRVASRVSSGYQLGSEKSLLQEQEDFVVPIISLGVLKTFGELGATALAQVIQFRLDESGAKLRSESDYSYLGEDGRPREFVFDKPFLIYLVERQSEHPYLAMWIANEELLETADDSAE
ncbi:hypothetical protein Mal64_19420 [Pseudobythopirellula maris]|uniref:Serpin (Serine protease inhibitor) n=1 Tax=Pseudobythopirellula maris TaxID=2527991 RepID=A0A5C5ZMR3_9BACT|nr:hypothetical protein [Pseudobythopirellula maris]TWT88460.1 hypothetical protein Mal64_19420 [Pseudobythopirellula maris]